jgi:hypothetical protein
MNKIKYGILSAGILSLVLTFSVSFTKANPSFFLRGRSAALTTTLNYMTPGAATSTIGSLASDGTVLGYLDLGQGGAQGADSAVLALQFTGSTTPSNAAVATTTFSVAIEYSQDNVDWYSDSYSGFGTTTVAQNFTTQHTQTVTLGTQLLNGVLVASSTATKILFNVPTPTKYVRAIVSIPTNVTNNLNGAVWGSFVAKRQAN